MTFQAGDMVRVVSDTANTGIGGLIGSICTIEEVNIAEVTRYFISMPPIFQVMHTGRFYLYANDLVLIIPIRVGNIDPPYEFKVGDKVIIVQMTSGLSKELINQEAIVKSASKIASARKKKYIDVELKDKSIINVWIEDIRLAKPVVSSNFRQYVKSKMVANVASV